MPGGLGMRFPFWRLRLEKAEVSSVVLDLEI